MQIIIDNTAFVGILFFYSTVAVGITIIIMMKNYVRLTIKKKKKKNGRPYTSYNNNIRETNPLTRRSHTHTSTHFKAKVVYYSFVYTTIILHSRLKSVRGRQKTFLREYNVRTTFFLSFVHGPVHNNTITLYYTSSKTTCETTTVVLLLYFQGHPATGKNFG